MSLILDALRGGRPRPTPQPNNPNTAQTDAVLQTLGYGHFRGVSALNRIKRFLVYALAAVVLAAAIWGSVIWVNSRHFAHDTPAVTTHTERPMSPAPPLPPARSAASPASALPAAPPSLSSSLPSARIPAASPAGAPPSLAALSISAGGSAGTLVSQADPFQLALYYQRSGDFENALLQYRAVLQRDELNAEAHNNLGLLYRGKGLYDEAVKEFVRAIAINQRYVKAHNNLGVTYLNQRRDDAGASEFRTALAIDPRNVESLVNLSLAEKNNRNHDEARALLIRALEIDPRSVEAHYNFALMADDAGDKAAAITHYRAFLQYANDHPDLVPQVRARLDALSR